VSDAVAAVVSPLAITPPQLSTELPSAHQSDAACIPTQDDTTEYRNKICSPPNDSIITRFVLRLALQTSELDTRCVWRCRNVDL